MFSRINGVIFNLSINNAPFERLFHSDKNIVVSIFILILSCICGSIYPFLQYDSNLEFVVSEFIIKFIGLLSQNLFIISGLYFLGITFFANSVRAGISSTGISSKNPTKIDKSSFSTKQKNILTFKKHLNLLAFIQIPVLIGMISVLPIIREIKILPDIIIFICTLWLYTLIIRAIFVLYGYNLEVKDSLQLRYLKSFLIVIFTYIPSTMIFQLFISGLIKGVVELWI
ncbi:MAG: hypothetical protein CL907_06015 [Dehalococcoidia bacterium]|nr:hypothetical protein [Dehalococcoidia bacterium]|tara:strand:+ start:213 stop:896 length:684 start_codon:yes stop_codon:yes gene_type:complete